MRAESSGGTLRVREDRTALILRAEFDSSPTGRDLKPKTVALDVTSSQTVRVSPRSGFAPVTRGAPPRIGAGSRKLDQPFWVGRFRL